MMTITIFASLAVLIAGIVGINSPIDTKWSLFKSKYYMKGYDSHEDSVRRAIWEENHRRMEAHNDLYASGMSTFYLGENQFSDWTTSEFFRKMNGYRDKTEGSHHTTPDTSNRSSTLKFIPLPLEVNWVKEGYVTKVKGQYECGASWAFSATGAMEGAHFRKTGRLVSLSEKNLMDCSWNYGNQGCNGGTMDEAFQYVIDNKGVDTEDSYPFAPYNDVTCHFNASNIGATISGYRNISSGSEFELQKATATMGPISVAIDADHFSFMTYKGGVYDEPACSNLWLSLGVLVVGYGVDGDGGQFWLVKNSFGPTWGEGGFIKMSRNKNNQCGIARRASYPEV